MLLQQIARAALALQARPMSRHRRSPGAPSTCGCSVELR